LWLLVHLFFPKYELLLLNQLILYELL
jgi:hypothetical protein